MSKLIEKYLIKQVQEDIEEYLMENNADSSVKKGDLFLEWALANVFQLREDEIENAVAIGGKSDNGIDAVFEINNELFIIQSKYGSSQNIDAIHRFINDALRLLETSPDTKREAVIDATLEIRKAFKTEKKINCYYITNNNLNDWERSQITKALDGRIFINTNFYILDIDGIVEKIQLSKGELPFDFKNKNFKVKHNRAFTVDGKNGLTYITAVTLKNFADFISQDKDSDLIFYSNIRNYLNSTSINSGIKKTLENAPQDFWYYNNGITVVCEDIVDKNSILVVKAPQIVNGCQTAKNIYATYKKKSYQTAQDILEDGQILIRFIKIKNIDALDKKEFRDNITRYTNSQNAVKGLDFYALDHFQRDLKIEFEKKGYYYEIQRGSYSAEKNRRKKKDQFKGAPNYNYLIKDYNSAKKFVLPAKEVIQAFTAGIKMMPNIAYSRANELTPMGKRWEEIMNEETKSFSVESFLFPYLTWMYAKNTLKFNRTSESDSYKKYAAFLFVSTHYLLLLKLINKVNKVENDKLTSELTELLNKVYSDQDLNGFLLNITNITLKSFFRDSQIREAVGDDIRGFIRKISNNSLYWDILSNTLNYEIEDSILETSEWKSLKLLLEFKDIDNSNISN